ncbi:cyclase family protein [Candidatus Dependentiae bacterium]|nr:MAG: cyclase family protein [Candidatus Dependentiae bacterium]
MNIIDISWPISNSMSTYKNRADMQISQIKSVAKDCVSESTIVMHSHTGTHVDAPAHFIEQGKTIDQIPLEQLCGPCIIIDCTQVNEKITKKDLQLHQELLKDQKKVLLKTKNSFCKPTEPFNTNFIFLEESGAQFLVDCGIQTVGFDYLGIERGQQGHPTHKILLQHGIIIEGLRLEHVNQGQYILYCLPLPIQKGDGSPGRAILVQ